MNKSIMLEDLRYAYSLLGGEIKLGYPVVGDLSTARAAIRRVIDALEEENRCPRGEAMGRE